MIWISSAEKKETREMLDAVSREVNKRSEFVREWAKNYYESWACLDETNPRKVDFREIAAAAVDAAEAIYDELNSRHPQIDSDLEEK